MRHSGLDFEKSDYAERVRWNGQLTSMFEILRHPGLGRSEKIIAVSAKDMKLGFDTCLR